MTVYFISDLHLGHQAIIKYCNRPFLVDGAPSNWKSLDNWKEFVDVERMNRTIIERWNATVKPHDTVWCLGDFCFGDDLGKRVFHELRGIKHLIVGNHDSPETLALPWSSVGYYQALNGKFEPCAYKRRPKLVLSHYGMRSWHAMQKGCIMLYGHSHGKLPGFRFTDDGPKAYGGGTLDVGCDLWDFYPVTLEQIKARLLTLPAYSPEVHQSPV